MHFRIELSSSASRPIEAMVWTNEIESAKSTADLKTSIFSAEQSCRQTSWFLILKKRVRSRSSSAETSKEELSQLLLEPLSDFQTVPNGSSFLVDMPFRVPRKRKRPGIPPLKSTHVLVILLSCFTMALEMSSFPSMTPLTL